MTNNYDKDLCLAEIARENTNENYCNKINDQNIKDDCYYNIVSDNILICGKIMDEKKNNDCRVEVAKNTKNEKICATVLYPSSCYSELALIKENYNLCDLMTVNKVDKGNCTTKEGGSPQSCSEYQRDICYYKVGTKLDIIEACSMIINHFRRNDCIKSNN